MKKSLRQKVGKRIASIVMSALIAFTGVGLLPQFAMTAHAMLYFIDLDSASATETENLSVTEDSTINLSGTSNGNIVKITVAAYKTATINLNDVNIDVSSSQNICAFNISGAGNAVINLSGTNVLKSGELCAGLQKDSTGSLTISGTGSLEAIGGLHGAGIGGRDFGSCSNIVISGGTVTAIGGSGAGIGGGNNGSGSNIEISGGTVTAIGGSGAGIGGGDNGSGSNIEISGGTVTATSEYGGAGIGGGYSGSGSNIEISGGTVTAIGSCGGAGIGGGKSGTGSDVTISGDAYVSVAGGAAQTDPSNAVYGAGAGIGNGGGRDSGQNPVNGTEVAPDLSSMNGSGCLKYFTAGTTSSAINAGTVQPTGTITGPFYAITVNSAGHGSASASESYAASGTDITLTAIPDSNYIFSEWLISPNTVSISNDSFSMPDSAVTVTAVFEVDPQTLTTPSTTTVAASSETEPPVNPMQEVEDDIAAAIALGGEQTVTIKGYSALSSDVMELLAEHPQITVVTEFSFDGLDYKITIPGSAVKLNPAIEWYGPKYLFPMFYMYGTDTTPSLQAYVEKYPVPVS